MYMAGYKKQVHVDVDVHIRIRMRIHLHVQLHILRSHTMYSNLPQHYMGDYLGRPTCLVMKQLGMCRFSMVTWRLWGIHEADLLPAKVRRAARE